MEFPGGLAGLGSHIIAVVAQVTIVVWVKSLTQELLHAIGMAKRKKNKIKWKKNIQKI